MKARLVLRRRTVLPDGAILEARIWIVPSPVPPSTHSLKYSLFYGYPGVRLVGYENERGKGDHKHLGEVEHCYSFVSIEQLLADFLADVSAERGSLP
jgi:Family of unknown function (DUF6516)